MDLSNLSTTLPLTKPVNQASVDELNEDLNAEFKKAAKSVASLYNLAVSGNTQDVSKQKTEFADAAKSVATLYRLSYSSNSLLKNLGYLECLDDLLAAITNGEDIENWALTKRAEIINLNNTNNDINNSPETSNTIELEINKETSTPESKKKEPLHDGEDFKIPLDFEFSLTLDISPGYHFIPSLPPISVTHSHKQRQSLKHLKKKDPASYKKLISKLQDSGVSSEEYESDLVESNVDSDADFKYIKKLLHMDKDESAKKRRKIMES